MVGELSGNVLDPHVVQAVAVKDLPCHLIGGKSPGVADLGVFIKGRANMDLR